MNRGLLEKPFDPGQIRRRQGRNGMLDYVEGHRASGGTLHSGVR